MTLGKDCFPSPPSWRPCDAPADVRAVGRLRRGLRLGAVAGVEAVAVIRGEVAGPHEVPASPQPPSYGMPSDSESHWTRSVACPLERLYAPGLTCLTTLLIHLAAYERW